jgi:hypothetical protein
MRVHWLHGPNDVLDRSRVPRERRHDPFNPRVPQFVLARPTVTGLLLTVLGIAGTWVIISRMATWPSWMLFPSMFLATVFLVAMMLGLGLLVVCGLEPVINRMDIDWGDAPVESLGVPDALQRKLERLNYWTAHDVVVAIEAGTFPWTSLEYDERQQIARASDRWEVADRSARPRARKRRLPFGKRLPH